MDLYYLEKLQHILETTSSTGFSTPALLVTENAPCNPSLTQAHATPRRTAEITTTYPKPTFYADVNSTRTLPKNILSPLEPGYEIQWARLTQVTLEEFSFIDDKLKLKSLMHQMTKHNTARQAASVHLLQAIQDPTHNPLHAFFKWLHLYTA